MCHAAASSGTSSQFPIVVVWQILFYFFHWNFIATGLTNSWFLFMCTKIMSELCKSITLSQFHALWLTNNSMLFIFAPFLHSEPSAEDCRCCSIKWKWFFVHLNGKLFVVLFAAERSNRLSTAMILMSIEGFFGVLQNKMKLMKCNEKKYRSFLTSHLFDYQFFTLGFKFN